MTQEEILIVCCPEFLIGLLFIGEMDQDIVVNVYGCRRFTKYTGYLTTYKCEGYLDFDKPTRQDMGAHIFGHRNNFLIHFGAVSTSNGWYAYIERNPIYTTLLAD